MDGKGIGGFVQVHAAEQSRDVGRALTDYTPQGVAGKKQNSCPREPSSFKGKLQYLEKEGGRKHLEWRDKASSLSLSKTIGPGSSRMPFSLIPRVLYLPSCQKPLLVLSRVQIGRHKQRNMRRYREAKRAD